MESIFRKIVPYYNHSKVIDDYENTRQRDVAIDKFIDREYVLLDSPLYSMSSDSTDDHEILDLLVVSNQQYEATLDPHNISSKLEGECFSKAIQIFLDMNFSGICSETAQNGQAKAIFNDFALYTAIAGKEELDRFILAHQNDCTLALVPYVVTNIGYGLHDHTVLLAVNREQCLVFDPRFSHNLGGIKDKVEVVALWWQEDDSTSGFYVYHLITRAIMASQSDDFNSVNYFKNISKPSLKEVRDNMRQLYDNHSELIGQDSNHDLIW